MAIELQREILRRQHGVAAASTSPSKANLHAADRSIASVDKPRTANAQSGLKLSGLASTHKEKENASTGRRVSRLINPTTFHPSLADVCLRQMCQDLFGRPIVENQRKRASVHVAEGPSFRFKYHEGVTDAVRRTVRVRDLL